VVAGTARRDAVGAGLAERRQLVERPADLERTGALQALGLQRDVALQALAEGHRRQHGRVLGHVGDRGPRAPDIVHGDSDVRGQDRHR
jgi:hypothetical protein